MGFRDETKFWLQAPWHFLGKRSEHPGTFLPNMRLPCLSATKLMSFPSFGVFVGSVVIQGGEDLSLHDLLNQLRSISQKH